MNQTLRSRLCLRSRISPIVALTALLVLMLSTRALQAATYSVSAGNVTDLINAIDRANANQEPDTIGEGNPALPMAMGTASMPVMWAQ